MSVIRLAAIDDHPVVVEGVAAILTRAAPDIAWLGARNNWATFQEFLAELEEPPDLVLLDLYLHDGTTPTERIDWLSAHDIRCVVLTSELRPVPIREAIAAGAYGVVLKPDPVERMLEVIRSAAGGDFAVSGDLAMILVSDEGLVPKLAPRELDALRLVASGLPRKAIGRRMDPPVQMSTVITYLNRVCEKYRELGRDVLNPQEAVRAATLDGYLDTADRPREH